MVVKCVSVGPLGTNCYIVGCDRSGEAIVIDPGAEPDRIIRALRAAGLECRLIVNTHAHADHIMANGALKRASGAAIAVHRVDADALSDPVASLAALTMTMRGRPEPASPPPDRLLEEGDIVVAGSARLRVLHTPGHTPGSISLFGEGAVFSGDTLFAGGGIGRTDLPGGSYEALVESIERKLFGLPDDTVVYPGHGPSTTIARERW